MRLNWQEYIKHWASMLQMVPNITLYWRLSVLLLFQTTHSIASFLFPIPGLRAEEPLVTPSCMWAKVQTLWWVLWGSLWSGPIQLLNSDSLPACMDQLCWTRCWISGFHKSVSFLHLKFFLITWVLVPSAPLPTILRLTLTPDPLTPNLPSYPSPVSVSSNSLVLFWDLCPQIAFLVSFQIGNTVILLWIANSIFVALLKPSESLFRIQVIRKSKQCSGLPFAVMWLSMYFQTLFQWELKQQCLFPFEFTFL